ncbi:Protein FIZZY-related 2 [Forsythia ovata]|uniref:Protein FIZZY-related 2 n=1 Tax=Forsythia ovata TaxID=205694 RepID=A0ABD1WL61_9LAMI
MVHLLLEGKFVIPYNFFDDGSKHIDSPKMPMKNLTQSARLKLVTSAYSPSPLHTIYSDCFMHCQPSLNFALFDLHSSNNNASSSDDLNSAYNTLLKTAIFGPEW